VHSPSLSYPDNGGEDRRKQQQTRERNVQQIIDTRYVATLACALLVTASPVFSHGNSGPQTPQKSTPLTIKDQGSFAFGGVVLKDATGNTFHGDHGYARYQIPTGARKYPMVMWHGGGQFSKSWETTPDGREGYQNIFLRRGFSTYIIDQPRRGGAGKTTIGRTIPDGTPNEASSFTIFRLGRWDPPATPQYFPGVQFSKNPEALNQYLRQITVDTGPDTLLEVGPNAVAELLNKTGPAILLTHSMSGLPGWFTATKNKNVKAIVAYEPVRFVFPDRVPATKGFFPSVAIPRAEFLKLTKMPIQIVFGDNLDKCCEGTSVGPNYWANAAYDAKLMVDAINALGGQAEVLHLPRVGIKGNTHFPFSDLNSNQVADNLSAWLKKKRLD
jgi:hypothetical protein